jgi:hypothetical protein
MSKKFLRAIWKHTHTAARQHLIAQAEVMNATNLLQDMFWNTFSIAMSLERPMDGSEWYAEMKFRNHALAMWHTIPNDGQQRKMAIAALSTVPTKLKLSPAFERLNWADKKATKLAEYRNLIAHNPITFSAYQKGRNCGHCPVFWR